jgi:anhydro-N-acetylmuramic acid kinase
MKKTYTLGLMSGTSVDAIDASLLLTEGKKDRLLLHLQFPYRKDLQQDILRLIREPSIGLDRFSRLHYAVGEAFAAAAEKTIRTALKKKLLRSRSQLAAIGSHGQTVFHDPEGRRSLQIGESALIAARTGLTTVSDFRVADTALGGEGAPLLPYYHRRLFSGEARHGLTVHNLGGISNFTYVGPKGKIFALDTGPASCLLDGAIQALSAGKNRFDKDGAIARLGRVSKELQRDLMNQPEILAFRRRKAPKSTGRELFSPKLLETMMQEHSHLLPEDLLHTLTHFTVDLIVESYDREIFRKRLPIRKVVLTGGGSRNGFLLKLLRQGLPQVEILTMEDFGWSSQSLESQAFGHFAWLALEGKPITFPTTTGAMAPAICGKISHPPQG